MFIRELLVQLPNHKAQQKLVDYLAHTIMWTKHAVEGLVAALINWLPPAPSEFSPILPICDPNPLLKHSQPSL